MARVLLVEDDSQVGELVRRFLEREGFAVAWVRFGREALERVGAVSYTHLTLPTILRV